MTAITFFSFVYARGGVRFSFPMAFCARVCSTWEDSARSLLHHGLSWCGWLRLLWVARTQTSPFKGPLKSA